MLKNTKLIIVQWFRKEVYTLIIGIDYFGYGFDQQFYNTAIPTSELDEITIGAGMYDELFISVDETMSADQTLPDDWTLMTVMDADFNN